MRVLRNILVLGFVVGVLTAARDGRSAEGRTRMPNYYFLGEWRTAKGASPAISIVFRGKTHDVTVDGQPIAMTGGLIHQPTYQKLFHFQKLVFEGEYGGESYFEIGLIAGVMGSKDVLSGFYSEMHYNAEGEDVRGRMVPVVLFKVPAGPQAQPKAP
jgi:hypothetical protein